MAETKYAVVEGLECKDPRMLKKMTLAEARIKACRIADKTNPYKRVGIFKEDKYHISGGSYMPKLIEDIYYDNGDYYLLQWGVQGVDPASTSRQCRVSPKTGKLLDMNKYWKYY